MLAQRQQAFSVMYTNVVDCVVVLITTLLSTLTLLTYSCSGPVLSNFILQNMKCSSGREKSEGGKKPKRFLHIYEPGKTQTSISKNTVCFFLSPK